MTVKDDGGISLRDWFAIKAMQQIMSVPSDRHDLFRSDGYGGYWKERAAKTAYGLADAMIEARKS